MKILITFLLSISNCFFSSGVNSSISKEKFGGILDNLPKFAQPVNLILPQLQKKIELPKLQKI